jgi:hypothetical protein
MGFSTRQRILYDARQSRRQLLVSVGASPKMNVLSGVGHSNVAQEMKKATDAGKIIKVKREYMLAEGEKAKK